MTTIRLGVVGLGRFAALHLACIRAMPDVTVAAVCDLNAEAANEAAERFHCPGFTDWKRMLAEADLDAVDVLTPESTHFEIATAALDSGCHVFVEKPLALRAEEGKLMARKALEQGKLLMVGHVCRFDVRYVRTKQAIVEGSLGRLRSIYARRNNGKQFFSLYRRANPIYVLGIHDIDLLRWFADSEVEEVFAYRTENQDGDCDLVWSMLKFENGVIGVIENNWLLPEKAPAFMDTCMEVVGKKGTVQLREPDQSLVFWDTRGTVSSPLVSGYENYGRTVGPLHEELHHFFRCVAEGRPSDILKAEDAVKAVEVAEAILQSCERGTPVRLHPAG